MALLLLRSWLLLPVVVILASSLTLLAALSLALALSSPSVSVLLDTVSSGATAITSTSSLDFLYGAESDGLKALGLDFGIELCCCGVPVDPCRLDE